MKEPRENEVFGRLEREMVHDLSVWRRELTGLFTECYREVLAFERARVGEEKLLTTPESVQAVRQQLTEYMEEAWEMLDDAPQPGEYMQITGPARWYDPLEQDGTLTAHVLMEDRTIYGNYVDWKILPYYDDESLGASPEPRENPAAHAHLFGVHLVIEEPTFTDANNNVIQLYRDEVYIPLHHDHARFVVYGNWTAKR